MRGVAPPREQARIVKYRRCGADRRQPPTAGILSQHQGANARIGAQVFYARAARKENAVEFPSAVGFDGSECGVGMHDHPGATRDVDAFAEGGDSDFGAGTAQQIDGRDRFNLLKPVR